MRIARFLLLALGLALPVVGQPPRDDYKLSTAEVRKDVVAVISEQLVHFREGEPGKAYALAALRFQSQFTVERFAAVVKGAYPEIWANTGAQFGVVRDDGVSAVVLVQVTPREGKATGYDYFLLKENHVWRIGGVVRHGQEKPQV